MKRGALIATAAMIGAAFATSAQAAVGAPTPGGHDFQEPATQVMREIVSFHNFLLPIIIVISVFVLALLLWVMVRYNRRANPTPKKFTHNMLVEVIWTVVPVLILVAIAWRSFPLIYMQEQIPEEAELTLKVTGNSWRWDFEYPDLGVALTSNLLAEEDAAAGKSSVPAGDRYAALRSGWHNGARSRDIERRDPCFCRACVRREGRRHHGPRQRDMVQRRS